MGEKEVKKKKVKKVKKVRKRYNPTINYKGIEYRILKYPISLL